MNKTILIIVGIFILIGIVLVIIVGKAPTPYSVQDEVIDEVDWGWIEENCDCVERDRFYCKFEGYELGRNNMCWKESNFTNPVRGCSEYNCSGEIHKVD